MSRYAEDDSSVVQYRKLFVSRLHAKCDDYQLKRFFSNFGPVNWARVVCDNKSGRSLCYGFVLFKHRRYADQVLASHRQTPLVMHGREQLSIDYARSTVNKAPSTMDSLYSGPDEACHEQQRPYDPNVFTTEQQQQYPPQQPILTTVDGSYQQLLWAMQMVAYAHGFPDIQSLQDTLIAHSSAQFVHAYQQNSEATGDTNDAYIETTPAESSISPASCV